jgi:DNA-binding PadR family transcriptional regulator
MKKLRITNPALDVQHEELKQIERALHDLAEWGLVEDTGERRDGRIVWRATELGRRVIRDGGGRCGDA